QRTRSMATLSIPITTEELLAMPDDGTRRWLVEGDLNESPRGLRDRFNSAAFGSIGTALEDWLRKQPQPRGQVLGGEDGKRPVLFNVDQELSADPHLPGLCVPVSRLFE